MAPYNTKQRKILSDFLEKNADKQFTAEEISEALISEGISKSAVYRNLADLESEGKVHRIAKEGERKLYYQNTGACECRDELHLSCKKCGKTIHMDHETAEKLIEGLEGLQSFSVDKHDTILYGTCGECRKNSEEKNEK